MKARLLLLLTLITFAARSQWTNSGFLHRDGREVRDAAGNAVKLYGVNLGGWLMWESWIMGNGYMAEKNIVSRMAQKVGQPAANQFHTDFLDSYMTEADIEAIAGQCFNIVRIPVNHTILEDDSDPYSYKSEGFARLDTILKWCERHNVYALLDLHGAPCGQNPYFISDPDSPNMWDDNSCQVRTKSIWMAIANRYKNRGIIAGYDLLNEPKAPDGATLSAFYDMLISNIRTIDTNHLLFIEGAASATDFSMFPTLPDPNCLFEFHVYTWFTDDIPGAYSPFVQLSEHMNVPVWCGEWGENSYSELQETADYLTDPAHGIAGHAFWTWKKYAGGSSYPGYVTVNPSALWTKSIKWITNGFNSAPTAAEMTQGMSEYLASVAYANCTFNDTMNAILSACSYLGLNGNEAENQKISVYPNPARDLAILRDRTFEEIELIDATGRIVKTCFSDAEGKILLGAVSPGMYTLRVKSSPIQTIRLIIE